jgi:hypothetical protein
VIDALFADLIIPPDADADADADAEPIVLLTRAS